MMITKWEYKIVKVEGPSVSVEMLRSRGVSMKLCKDCRWFVLMGYPRRCVSTSGRQEPMLVRECGHSECLDPVTGEEVYAGWARSCGVCGHDGRYWEAKE